MLVSTFWGYIGRIGGRLGSTDTLRRLTGKTIFSMLYRLIGILRLSPVYRLTFVGDGFLSTFSVWNMGFGFWYLQAAADKSRVLPGFNWFLTPM